MAKPLVCEARSIDERSRKLVSFREAVSIAKTA
jgi:hypothetical protein